MADNRRSSARLLLTSSSLLFPASSPTSIPKSFLKHLGFEESSEDNDFIVVLKDPSCGAGNGKTKSWSVQVYGRHFLNGWKEFADDHGLSVGEFIVFNHTGGFEFEVVVFDPISACPRSFAAEKPRRVKSEGTKKSADYKTSGNPYFRKSVHEYCFKWGGMLLPIPFARDNGLWGRSCEMRVIDQKDRSWTVTLKQRQSQLCLSSGWSDLARANSLKFGDFVIYELVESGSHPIMKFYKERSAKTSFKVR